MRRSNQFSTPEEIRANFKSVRDPNRHAGVPVYGEPGNLWVDDSYRHVQVIGNTGEGKTECVVKTTCRDILHRGESLLLLNIKGDVCRELAGHVPENYRKIHINFNDPWGSPDSWNPWTYITDLFHSGDMRAVDRACEAVYSFWQGLLGNTFTESFWPEAATDYLKGISFGLLELAKPDQVNLESLDSMMCHAEEKFGRYSYTRAFYEMLPENSLAKSNLSGYVFAPDDTRMSIFTTARRGLSIFGISQGLRQLMMQDTLDIAHLDPERPFACFITMPQESGIYSSLAALLVEQLVGHLKYTADRRPDGRLPIRTHVVLEELGKVGRCIPSLPGILAAGRSMGLRALLVLQSSQQLTEVYGQANAENINACTDLNICFSTSNAASLQQWADSCGLTDETVNGYPRAVPLITPTQLRGMAVGEALVITKSLKFRTRLPFYYQLTAGQETPEPTFRPRHARKAEAISFCEFIKARKRAEMMEMLGPLSDTAERKTPSETPLHLPVSLPSEAPQDLFPPSGSDASGRPFRHTPGESRSSRQESPAAYNVIVLDAGKNPKAVAKAVSEILRITCQEAWNRLHSGEKLVSIPFQNRPTAESARSRLAQEGAIAVISPEMNNSR